MVDNLDEGFYFGDFLCEVFSDGLGLIKVQYIILESLVVISSELGVLIFGFGLLLMDLFKGIRDCGQGIICSGVVLEFI